MLLLGVVVVALVHACLYERDFHPYRAFWQKFRKLPWWKQVAAIFFVGILWAYAGEKPRGGNFMMATLLGDPTPVTDEWTEFTPITSTNTTRTLDGDDFRRGFVFVRIDTNCPASIFNSQLSNLNTQFSSDWCAFGAASDWVYANVEWGMWNGEWGTGNGERRKIPAWKEIVVAFAGPAMNIVLAVILAVVISLVPSDRFGTTPAVVGEVISDGPAEKAGIKPGDRIVSVAGRPIASWNELQTEVQIVGDKEAEFVLDRGGEEVSVRVTPERDKVSGACMISAVSETHPEGLPGRWLPSRNPWEQLKYDAGGIFRVLKGLVTPKEMKETGKAIGGPVMIAQGIYYSMRADFLNGMGFFRFLNVNLAIINLLPIPVLDGGLILFALIALVFRRRVPEKVVNSLTMVFMCLLLTLMAFLIYRDSARAWRMHKAEKAEEAEVVRKPAPPPAAAEGQDGGADRSRGAGGDVKDADKGTD